MPMWYNGRDMLTSGNIFSQEKRFFLYGVCERVGHYIGGSGEKRGCSQGTSSYVYGGYDDGRRVYHWFRCFRFSFCQSQCRLACPAYVACRSRIFFCHFHALCGRNGAAHVAAFAALRAGGKVCRQDRFMADFLFCRRHVLLQSHRLYERLRQDFERIFRYFPGNSQLPLCPRGDERGLAGA